jgi:beta-glucanase (GH16 family)
MPKANVYGTWPSSGEIDLMESRGNRRLFDGNTNVGVEQVGHTLHFGPRADMSAWPTAHSTAQYFKGFNSDFHTYKLVWTNESITFMIDDVQTGFVEGGEGFWNRGGFNETGRDNPWQRSSNMAPFDQEFYVILNLAIGGTNFFNDGLRNEGSPKPWNNNSPRAASDFWEGRDGWMPTWNRDTDDSHLQIDSVRVWAL